MKMKLELVPVPVKDIDRAKEFYTKLGFRVDLDVTPSADIRIVQLTPEGSGCSISLTKGLSNVDMPAGSIRGLHLVVEDIDEARNLAVKQGVKVDEVVDMGGIKYAFFADPEGNTWTFQYIPQALRGLS